jgi:hypothetical protein
MLSGPGAWGPEMPPDVGIIPSPCHFLCIIALNSCIHGVFSLYSRYFYIFSTNVQTQPCDHNGRKLKAKESYYMPDWSEHWTVDSSYNSC